jgi:hypothetical protein
MPLAAGASLGALCWVVLGASLSGCGASSALSSAVLAPLSVLPDTDVVLETNLQAAVQGGLVSGGISGPGGAGAPEVSGPPTTASEVSVATTGTVSVYTAFNPVDRHCLGTFVLKPGSFTTVLGVSTAGTYDFWFGPTTSAACASNLFTTATTVPKGWATGDPASGWPLP